MKLLVVLCILPLLACGQDNRGRVFGQDQDGKPRLTEQRLGGSYYHHHPHEVHLHHDGLTHDFAHGLALHEVHQATYELPHYITSEQQHHLVHAVQPHVATVHAVQPQVHTVHAVQPHVTTVHAVQPHVATVHTVQPHVATLQTIQPHTIVQQQGLGQPQVSGYVNHGGVRYDIPTVGHHLVYPNGAQVQRYSPVQFAPPSSFSQRAPASTRQESAAPAPTPSAMQDIQGPGQASQQQQQRQAFRYPGSQNGYYNSESTALAGQRP